MVFVLPLWVMPLSVGLACGYAILEGEVEERVIGCARAIFLAIETILYMSEASPNGLAQDFLFLGALFAVSLAVALRSNKLWPLIYSAVTLVAAMTVLATVLISVGPWARGTANFVWSCLQIAALAAGTWRVARSRRQLAIVAT